MTIRLYADSFRCAIFDEAPGGGSPADINSLMNRPALDPSNWLDNIYFHSEFDYYGVAAYTLGTSLTHGAIAGITRNAGGGTGEVSTVVTLAGQSGSDDQLLLTHNLGYVPDFYAIINGVLAPNGVPIQRPDAFRMRFACVYATTTEIRVATFGFSSASDLSSISAIYGVIVFRDHAAIPGEKMLKIAPGDVIFGQGKFNMQQPHLRADGAGDSPFAIALSKTAAARNGGLRLYKSSGSYEDWGSFNGSLSAPTFISVAVGL